MHEEQKKATSAFDDLDDTVELHAPHWSPWESVTARIVPTVEDEEWVNNQVVRMTQADKGVDFESRLGATRRLWLQRLIVSWTFTQRGQPVELSAKAIKRLPTHYADYIYDEVMKLQPQLNQEEEDDFLDAAESSTEGVKRLAPVK